MLDFEVQALDVHIRKLPGRAKGASSAIRHYPKSVAY
jgi:hypothetical protein